MTRTIALLTVLCVCGVTACEAPEDSEVELRAFDLQMPLDPVGVPIPLDAFCSIDVKNHGTKAMETDYLPNVLACEAPGTASLEMLKAQAIAARSYAYYHAASAGQICNGQGCQVFSCGRTPSALHRQAVADTSGMILRYNDNLTIGFYVAGDKTPNADCTGNSAGVASTERWVTYNEGKTGSGITQTKIAWRHSPGDTDWGQNRGALSQWGAHCLADTRGYDAVGILRFFYGDDIELQSTQGQCIGEVDIDADAGGEDCGLVDPDALTIIDNEDECLTLVGPQQYWRTERSGHGGSLRWTKSTQNTEHNVATWWLNFEHSGDYRVEVHIDPAHTSATDARYEVIDGFASTEISVDQTAGGWIELGVFAFDADASDQQVRMSDAIGIKDQILQADAVRLTPVDEAECEEIGCHADDPGGAASGERGGPATGCHVDPRSGPRAPGVALLVLGLLGGVRRVRRRGSTPR